jgi:hypothetical protein
MVPDINISLNPHLLYVGHYTVVCKRYDNSDIWAAKYFEKKTPFFRRKYSEHWFQTNNTDNKEFLRWLCIFIVLFFNSLKFFTGLMDLYIINSQLLSTYIGTFSTPCCFFYINSVETNSQQDCDILNRSIGTFYGEMSEKRIKNQSM